LSVLSIYIMSLSLQYIGEDIPWDSYHLFVHDMQ
jgi:hypothetical protein